jgi:hypothetical protein
MRRRNWLCLAAVLAVGLAAPNVRAAIILEYDTSGLPSSSPPATWSATTVASGLSAAALSHGPGTVAAGLGNGFSANNWTTGTGNTQATAETNGDYFEWAMTVQPGNTASLSSLNFSLRRSAVAAPDSYAVEASTDGFATAGTTVATFNYLGRSSGTAPGTVTPFQWMTTDTPGQGDGNPVSTIDLSTTPSLQNIAAGTTVTFRLLAWGNIAGSADTNTVAMGRSHAAANGVGSGGPSVQGTVTAVPEPAMLALVGCVAVGGLVFRRRG